MINIRLQCKNKDMKVSLITLAKRGAQSLEQDQSAA